MVTTARDIMTQDAQCVQESQTLINAATGTDAPPIKPPARRSSSCAAPG